MATAVVSGRVDERVRDRAGAYIQAAGLTPGDVIKAVWENIAHTGELPTTQTGMALFEIEGKEAPYDPFEAFMEFRDTLPEPDPKYAWLSQATPEELKDFLAEERLKDYERL